MTHDRIAQRRRALRAEGRRRRLRRTIVVGAVAATVVAVVAVDRSGVADIREVDVVGARRTPVVDVRDAAGVVEGTSGLRVRPRQVAARVQALPTIATAEARRAGRGVLQITVVEREPVLQVVGPRGHALVDRDGIVIDIGTDDSLPVIELRTQPPEPGSHVEVNGALANAHRVWRGLSGPLRAEVVRYVADGPDELTLRLKRGIDVRFGRAERIDEKIRAIGAVLGDLDDARVDYIDVRAPGRPVVAGS